MNGEEEEEKGWLKPILDFWWLWFAIAIAIFFRDRWGMISQDRAMTLAEMIVVGATMFQMAWAYMKHKSPKVIMNPYHFSWDGTRTRIGNYYLVRLGGIRMKEFNWPGSEGTLITLVDSAGMVGDNLVTTARAEEVKIQQTPLEVQGELISKNFPKPLYLAYADDEQYIERLVDKDRITGLPNPTVTYLITELKEKNSLITMLADMLKEKGVHVEEFVKTASRIVERASTKDLFKAALNKITGSEER